MKKLYHLARILAAVILLQTLYFKFTAHPDSVALFTQIGLEPYGRIGVGILELLAGAFLLFGGRYVYIGAVMGVAMMLGAVYYHATILGYNSLFVMALVALLCCVYILRFLRKELGNFR